MASPTVIDLNFIELCCPYMIRVVAGIFPPPPSVPFHVVAIKSGTLENACC